MPSLVGSEMCIRDSYRHRTGLDHCDRLFVDCPELLRETFQSKSHEGHFHGFSASKKVHRLHEADHEKPWLYSNLPDNIPLIASPHRTGARRLFHYGSGHCRLADSTGASGWLRSHCEKQKERPMVLCTSYGGGTHGGCPRRACRHGHFIASRLVLSRTMRCWFFI